MKINQDDAKKILSLSVGSTYCTKDSVMYFRATKTKWACEGKSVWFSAADIKEAAGLMVLPEDRKK